MKNNNSGVIRLLSGKLYASNRRRNRILTGAVAASLFLLLSISSIVAGRIQAEKLRFMRMAGTAATTFLQTPTKEQAEQIAGLDYIRDVGKEYIFGEIYQEEEQAGVQVYVDEKTFETMLEPAYAQIHGSYPKRENEVMLARRTLDTMGIKTPETGMEVRITTGEGKTETFILSGFYTEFVDEQTPPYGFFSRKYYEGQGNSTSQGQRLAIRQKDWYSGESIEDMLYRDIPTIDDIQQFIGGDSVNYTAVLALVGGLDIGLVAVLLIMFCAGMLIYNVTAISLRREIRQYGLLKTLGTTSRQIHRIVWRQVTKILCIGLAAGLVAGFAFVFGILPKILEGRYLEGFGEASAMLCFHPFLLIAALLLTTASTLLSSFVPVWKLGKLAPVYAVRYMGGVVRTNRKSRASGKGNQIVTMAWRNIFRNRKNAWITLASLFLGFTVALGAMVIVRGLDYRNNIEREDDFKLSALSVPFLSEGYMEQDICLDDSVLGEIRGLEGIEAVKCTAGGFLRLDSSDSVWQPLLKGSRFGEGMQDKEEDKAHAEHVRKYYMAGYTVVDNDFIDALEECCKKHDLTIDIEGLREGTSAVAFHFGDLSRKLEEESLLSIGDAFSLKRFSGEDLGNIAFGGYLNRSQKDLPPIETESSTTGYPTLLISQKCAGRLGIGEDIFAVNINVNEDMEPQIKDRLYQIMTELQEKVKNLEGVFGGGYSMYVKSEAMALAESKLLPIRIVMYTVSALLACMGLFNYFNVTASSLEVRRREFAMLQSLGMTGKQLRRMLILEGVYYSSIIAVFMVSAGSGIVWLLYRLGRERVPYMRFYYPVAGLAGMLVFIYACCICLPLWMLHVNRGRNGEIDLTSP